MNCYSTRGVRSSIITKSSREHRYTRFVEIVWSRFYFQLERSIAATECSNEKCCRQGGGSCISNFVEDGRSKLLSICEGWRPEDGVWYVAERATWVCTWLRFSDIAISVSTTGVRFVEFFNFRLFFCRTCTRCAETNLVWLPSMQTCSFVASYVLATCKLLN